MQSLSLLEGKTLHLVADTDADNAATELKAQLTGKGSVDIDAAKAKHGSIIFSNNSNDYQGDTTVRGGTLILGADGALGQTKTLNILKNASVDLSDHQQQITTLSGEGELFMLDSSRLTIEAGGVFAGNIIGSGEEIDLTGGTLALTGHNTYYGKTLIREAASLEIGAGGTTGSYTGDISNAGSLSFKRSDQYTYAGNISGNGALIIDGSGTISFTGNVQNDVTIAQGALQIGNGGTAGELLGDVDNAGVLQFNRSDDITYAGQVSGTGSLEMLGTGSLTLTGESDYAGGTQIKNGGLILENTHAAGTGIITLATGTGLTLDFADADFSNHLAGAQGSRVNITQKNITLSGQNEAFQGRWDITGSASANALENIGSQSSINLDGELSLALAKGNFTFNNQLTGAGLLRISTEGSVVDLGTGMGKNFIGTLALADSTFTLGGKNTTALKNATLQMEAGSTVTVGSGEQKLSGLSFAGGTLKFDGALPPGPTTGTVSVDHLDLQGGAIHIDVPYEAGVPNPSTGANLFEQDDLGIVQKVLDANSVSGSGKSIELRDSNGKLITEAKELDITEGGKAVAKATYDFGLTGGANEDGLYVNYGLTALELLEGATLHLSPEEGAKGAAATMTATISGKGGLDLNSSASITIANSNNSYIGTTTVSGGKLILGSNNALGQTKALVQKTGTVIDMGGYSQTVGMLDTAADSLLHLNGGSLTISGEDSVTDSNTFLGKVNGRLAGSGELNITQGMLQVEGANAGLSAEVLLDQGAEVQTNSVYGLGTGKITFGSENDHLTFIAIDGESARGVMGNDLIGAGQISLTSSENIILAGDNKDFTGKFDIGATATLTATSAEQLGEGVVDNKGTFRIENNQDWTLENTITGSGSFVKSGMGMLLVNDTLQHTGNTDIQNGTLVVGDKAGDARIGNAAATVSIGAAGTLSGTGVIEGTVNNRGTIAALNVLAKYEAEEASNLTIRGNLANSGAVHLGGSAIGNTLTVEGNYIGGGSLYINSVLAGDDAKTDQLIIKGDSSGSTTVYIKNLDGTGAHTTDGIKIVDIEGASNGQFKLGDRVTIGMYDYLLNQTGGDWYLDSTNNTNDQPAIPELGVSMGSQAAAQTMFVHNFYDRVGENWSASKGAWARVFGSHTKFNAAKQVLNQDINLVRTQFGSDILAGGNADQQWRFGWMGSFARANIDSKSRDNDYTGDYNASRAQGKVDGYALGLYASFMAENRWYLDSWVQLARFENEVEGKNNADFHSYGLFASVEAGQRFHIANTAGYQWWFEPQVQVLVSKFNSNNYTTNSGMHVSEASGQGVTGRLGARLSVKDTAKGFTPFVEANVWLGRPVANTIKFSDNLDVRTIRSDMPAARFQLKVGAQGNLNKQWQVWGHMGAEISKDQYRGYQGEVGLKYQW